MPSKRTHMQVLDNFADCDLDPDMEPLSPLPETPSLPETPIQDENTDTGGKKSFVWRYFKAATVDGVLSNVCQVNKSPGSGELCLAALAVDKKKSTTSMLNHLGRKHQIYDKKMATGAITNLLHKGDILKILTRDSLTASVARFFVTCNVPFLTVEDKNFHQLLRLCNPSIDNIICSKDTISAYIQKSFRQGKQVLRKQLPDLKSKISLTCDTWTSPSNVSVLGITALWIDNDFSLQSITLAARLLEGSHTGVSLAEHLVEVLDEFDI
ncbi:hypothetical protein MJO28_016874 [Puccinia striiformis f. sp. tritici]|nr:hypothetical protein MJO28_016874 [Puccinia striiformis f. sp. tritici]